MKPRRKEVGGGLGEVCEEVEGQGRRKTELGGATASDKELAKTIGKEPADLGDVNGRKREEEVHDKDLRHGGSCGECEDGVKEEKKEDISPEMKPGGATNVTGGMANVIESEPAKSGRLKRPRLHQNATEEPQNSSSRKEEDIEGSGSVREEAQGEGNAGAKEDSSLGDSGVSAEGNNILEYNLTPRISETQKQKGAEGVGKPRGEQGSRNDS